jgi:hypothetical protein
MSSVGIGEGLGYAATTMTGEHLEAILKMAGAKGEKDGWVALPEGSTLTLHVAHVGAGMTVSRICLGCMSYGDKKWRDWVLNEKESRPFYEKSLEAGINFFDTADMYSVGVSEEITGRVLALDRSLEDALPYLYGLLGLTDENNQVAEIEAQTRKRRSLDAIKRILLRESLNQPVVVIFEDLHWIDDETQAFLKLLADSIGTARILLLVNYRPEYRHEWGHKTYYTQLRLDPLGKESADEMLGALLGDGVELGPLKRLIIEKT